MEKFKQSTYTLILIATCFLASPFILHKIWTSSADTKQETVSTSVSDDIQSTDENDSDNQDEILQSPDDTSGETDVPFIESDVSYFDDALFIGDSRTVGIKEYGIFKNSDYFCSVGMSAINIDSEEINDMTFDDAIQQKNYGKVYVMLGINEVGNDTETTLSAYKEIIDKIRNHQSDALIYIQGNLHVSADAQTDVINNTALNNLNSRLASLADNISIFYIDINEVYDDANGCFMTSYTSDGIHPLAIYYRKWCEWLCTKTIEHEIPEETVTENETESCVTDLTQPETSEETTQE